MVRLIKAGDLFVFLMNTNGTTSVLVCVNGVGSIPTASGAVLDTATVGVLVVLVKAVGSLTWFAKS